MLGGDGVCKNLVLRFSPGVLLEHSLCPMGHITEGQGIKWGSSGLEGRTVPQDCKLPLFSPSFSVFWELQLVASDLLSEQGNSPGAEPWALTSWSAFLGLVILPAQAISIACRKPVSFPLRFLYIKWHSFSSVPLKLGCPAPRNLGGKREVS